MIIETGGLRVFPRLLPAPGRGRAGRRALDRRRATGSLLGGGLDGGTATLLVGAAGTGKSSVTMQCATAALQRGHSVAVYLFDERPHVVPEGRPARVPAAPAGRPGNPALEQIDPAEMSPASSPMRSSTPSPTGPCTWSSLTA